LCLSEVCCCIQPRLQWENYILSISVSLRRPLRQKAFKSLCSRKTIYAACCLTVAVTPIKAAMAIYWSWQVLSVNLGLASWRVKLPYELEPAWSLGLYLQG